jgi:hypothetical protein
MSVAEFDKIDGMGKSVNGNELLFLITDHLDWLDEYNHLLILQDKINSYLRFIEAKQYADAYPQEIFDGYIIEIHFQYGVSENCLKFLDVVANQSKTLNVKIMVLEADGY